MPRKHSATKLPVTSPLTHAFHLAFSLANGLSTVFTFLYHTNLLQWAGISKFSDLESGLTNLATEVAERVPTGELHDLAEDFLQMENNGGLKLALQNETKTEIERCAHNIGGNSTEAEILLNCAINMPQARISHKIAVFTKCADIDTMAEAVSVIHDTAALSRCMAKDAESEAVDTAKNIKRISHDDLNILAKAFRQIDTNAVLKDVFQKGMQTEIEKCADVTGENPARAEELLGCIINAPQSGISKKVTAFIKCADINPFNAVDTVQNTVALAQCIGENMQQTSDLSIPHSEL